MGQSLGTAIREFGCVAHLVTQSDPHISPEKHSPMKRIASAAVVTLAIIAGSSGSASADGVGNNIGSLECIVEGGIGLIVTSSKAWTVSTSQPRAAKMFTSES